jgi:hypothetical protein
VGAVLLLFVVVFEVTGGRAVGALCELEKSV